jgi:hypothetical protein
MMQNIVVGKTVFMMNHSLTNYVFPFGIRKPIETTAAGVNRFFHTKAVFPAEML